ncbi:AgmX/PglI C-terminal domain-containing protein [Myxococcota bacterium]|nr:AgmX/PglI C-terminal domain-containing protein [Myxococcota bacterium]
MSPRAEARPRARLVAPPSVLLLAWGLFLAAGGSALAARRGPIPATPLPPDVAAAVREGERVQALSAEDVALLADRFGHGEASLADLLTLRVRWAAERDLRYWDLRWPVLLQSAGLPPGVALALPRALALGDLEGAASAAGLWREARPREPVLAALHAALLWGLGREGSATLAYADALRGSPVLTYHDRVLEPWLQGRGRELAGGPRATPRDAVMAGSLERNLRDMELPGRFLLEFLAPETAPLETVLPPARLQEDHVAAILLHHRDDLDACWSEEVAHHGESRGTLKLRFVVGPYGDVGSCRADWGSLDSRSLRRCVCGTASSWRFPVPEGGGIASAETTLTFPLPRKPRAFLTALEEGGD